MNDPVVNDEARNDRERQAQKALMKQARALAVTEYESGELDDWIQDESDKHDTFGMAHALTQWLDSGEPLVNLAAYIPACSLKDFRATIEHVIEKKAKMILEDL